MASQTKQETLPEAPAVESDLEVKEAANSAEGLGRNTDVAAAFHGSLERFKRFFGQQLSGAEDKAVTPESRDRLNNLEEDLTQLLAANPVFAASANGTAEQQRQFQAFVSATMKSIGGSTMTPEQKIAVKEEMGIAIKEGGWPVSDVPLAAGGACLDLFSHAMGGPKV